MLVPRGFGCDFSKVVGICWLCRRRSQSCMACRCRGCIRRRSRRLFVGVEDEGWCGVGYWSDFDGAVEAGGGKSICVFCVDSDVHDSVVDMALEDLEVGWSNSVKAKPGEETKDGRSDTTNGIY